MRVRASELAKTSANLDDTAGFLQAAVLEAAGDRSAEFAFFVNILPHVPARWNSNRPWVIQAPTRPKRRFGLASFSEEATGLPAGFFIH
jgi:hypothetical protein